MLIILTEILLSKLSNIVCLHIVHPYKRNLVMFLHKQIQIFQSLFEMGYLLIYGISVPYFGRITHKSIDIYKGELNITNFNSPSEIEIISSFEILDKS